MDNCSKAKIMITMSITIGGELSAIRKKKNHIMDMDWYRNH